MTAISDGVVIGIVLGLVFAAVSYYLFSRQTQLERKVSLMENILLDLKVTTEQTLLSSTEPPDHNDISEQEGPESGILDNSNGLMNNYREMNLSINQEDSDNKSENSSETREVNVDQTTPRPRNATSVIQVEKEKTSVSANYEAMTYKELVGIARQKGISGLRNMSKAQVIEALRGNTTSGASTLSNWSLNDNEVTPIHELGSAMEANQGEVIASLELEPEASLVNSE